MKELYEKYKGCQAEWNGREFVVCGYSDDCLIMAVIKGSKGWSGIHEDDVIVTHQNNPNGYHYIKGSYILIKYQPSNPTLDREESVSVDMFRGVDSVSISVSELLRLRDIEKKWYASQPDFSLEEEER